METNKQNSNLERLIEIADFESYTYLEGSKPTREQEKNKFLKGDINNPKLDYPKLDDSTVARFRQIAEELRQFIEENTKSAEFFLTESENTEIAQEKAELEKKYIETYAYVLKAQEKLAEIQMLIAAHESNSNEFTNKSIETFGSPQKRTYSIIKRQLGAKFSKLTDLSTELQEALARLRLNSPDLFIENDDNDETTTRNDQLFDLIQQSIDPRISFNEVETVSDNFTPEEFAIVCSRVLSQIQADGWTVEVQENAKNFSANQETKQIIIPRNEGALIERKKAHELLVHEIGTHVLRRVNGSRQKMQLLEIGLDRYLPGEEAIATLREYSVTKKRDLIGAIQQYLAIALAFGIDGNARDFRETFEIIKDIKVVLGESNPEEKAWNLVVRAFRGTDCQTKGAVYTKDLSYLDGRLDTVETLMFNPLLVKLLDIGKFNPSDFRHLLVLYSQGIIDENFKPTTK